MSNTNQHPGREGGRSYMQFERYGDNWVLEQVAYDGTEQVLHQTKIQQRLSPLKLSGQQTLMASNTSGH